MSEIVIVYWSGTGNTEMMANAIKEGIEQEEKNVSLKPVEEVSLDDVKDAKALVLGSPSMGAEELAEEMDEFLKQLFQGVSIRDKIAGAFGSYDWGDGEWMEDFVKRLKEDGFNVVGDGLIINLTPDEEGLEKCRAYGKEILKSLRKKEGNKDSDT